jgi:hypothetical protein
MFEFIVYVIVATFITEIVGTVFGPWGWWIALSLLFLLPGLVVVMGALFSSPGLGLPSTSDSAQPHAKRGSQPGNVGACAACGCPIHRNEPYYGHVDSGFAQTPGLPPIPYRRTLGLYHKGCAERSGLV